MSKANWTHVGGFLAAGMLALLLASALALPGACGPPVQVDYALTSTVSGSSGGKNSCSSSSGSPTTTIDAATAGTCIVDVSCTPPRSNRQEVFLSGDPATNPDAAGWKFNKGDVPGAQALGFDDGGWTSVVVPYTWNAIDGQQGPIMTPAYYRGVGWYRKHYAIPASMTGKRIYLQIDQAAFVTTAYVNGTQVGTHSGGKQRFRFDITANAMVGADNVIAVRVDNTAPLAGNTDTWVGGPLANVAPLNGDFTFFGGIQRDVRILATDDLAITPLDYGSPGVYLSASNIGSSSASFSALVKVLNAGAAAATASVEVDLLDETNGTVASFTGMQSVPAGMTAPITVGGMVTNPHLWQGLTDPYVYHANVIVKNGPLVTDAVVQPFGFRTYTLDATAGFSLNGKPYPLHGVAMHQDHPCEGDQFSVEDPHYLADIVNDFGMVEEIGANIVRAAHDQHSDFEYSLADYRGIVSWAENAFVDRISQNCTTDCTAFIANTTQQLTELIRQNFNHPAILFWSMGNEVLLAPGPDPTPVMQALVNTAKMEDTTRISIYAANAGTDANNLVWLPQATCFNEYFGWYYGKVADLGGWADAVHAAHPSNPMGLSEYGAGANPADHGLPIQETGTNRTATFQTEEYQAFFHEQYWPQIAARPWMSITTVWDMFDFASDYRNEGNEPGLNTKGLITYDRSTKKDAFYYYKAQWSQSPVTYITSRRFATLPKSSTTIKVYSNQPTVDLTLNGNDLGMQAGTGHVFQWSNVTWAPGANQASVTAGSGCTSKDPMACSDSVTWTN